MTDKVKLENRKIDLQFQLTQARANSFSLTWITIGIEILDYIIKNLVNRDGERLKWWKNILRYARFGFFVVSKLIK